MLDTTVPTGPRQGGFVSRFGPGPSVSTRAALTARYSNPATDPDLVEAVAVARAKARSRRVVRLDAVPSDDLWYVR